MKKSAQYKFDTSEELYLLRVRNGIQLVRPEALCFTEEDELDLSNDLRVGSMLKNPFGVYFLSAEGNIKNISYESAKLLGGLPCDMINKNTLDVIDEGAEIVYQNCLEV